MKNRSLTGFTALVLSAALVLGTGLLSACGSGSALNSNTDFGTPNSRQLTGQQRKIVDAAVRQIINDKGAATFQSMAAASAKQPDRTDVCGYVTYAARANGASAGAASAAPAPAPAPTQHRYFIQLGMENGKQAAVMGQVASDPAKRAKVAFMCKRAGLE